MFFLVLVIVISSTYLQALPVDRLFYGTDIVSKNDAPALSEDYFSSSYRYNLIVDATDVMFYKRYWDSTFTRSIHSRIFDKISVGYYHNDNSFFVKSDFSVFGKYKSVRPLVSLASTQLPVRYSFSIHQDRTPFRDYPALVDFKVGTNFYESPFAFSFSKESGRDGMSWEILTSSLDVNALSEQMWERWSQTWSFKLNQGTVYYEHDRYISTSIAAPDVSRFQLNDQRQSHTFGIDAAINETFMMTAFTRQGQLFEKMNAFLGDERVGTVFTEVGLRRYGLSFTYRGFNRSVTALLEHEHINLTNAQALQLNGNELFASLFFTKSYDFESVSTDVMYLTFKLPSWWESWTTIQLSHAKAHGAIHSFDKKFIFRDLQDTKSLNQTRYFLRIKLEKTFALSNRFNVDFMMDQIIPEFNSGNTNKGSETGGTASTSKSRLYWAGFDSSIAIRFTL